MSLTSKEAAQTLSDVERAARRSAQALGYSRSAPHLFVWGLVWLAGYSATEFYPEYSAYIWIAFVAAGMAGSVAIGKASYRSCGAQSGARNGLRMFGLIAIVWVFIAATYLIMQPVQGLAPAAFPALIVGTVYCGLGMWLGVRYLILGAVVIALTVGGFFYLPQYYLLWMAFVGGGALILAGLWFRQV